MSMRIAFETLNRGPFPTSLWRLSFLRREVQGGQSTPASFSQYFDEEKAAKHAGELAAKTGGYDIRIDVFRTEDAWRLEKERAEG